MFELIDKKQQFCYIKNVYNQSYSVDKGDINEENNIMYNGWYRNQKRRSWKCRQESKY